MSDHETDKPKLPGNHGQFGVSDATEKDKKLDDKPMPKPPSPKGPTQTNAGDRS